VQSTESTHPQTSSHLLLTHLQPPPRQREREKKRKGKGKGEGKGKGKGKKEDYDDDDDEDNTTLHTWCQKISRYASSEPKRVFLKQNLRKY